VLARQLARGRGDREEWANKEPATGSRALRTLRQEEAPESRRAMQQLAERLEAGTARRPSG
jgi:hypothetical protein